MDWAVGTAFPDVDVRVWKYDYRRLKSYPTEWVDERLDFFFGHCCLLDILLHLSEYFPTVPIESFGQLIDLVNFFLE